MRWFLALLAAGGLAACKPPAPDLLVQPFVDVGQIARISRYRSCCGHDYSGHGEKNRSMKHYFHPVDAVGLSDDLLPITAPFAGKVYRISESSRELPCFGDRHGVNLYLRSEAQATFYLKFFHVNAAVEEGTRVEAGERIAWADTRECDPGDPSRIADHPTSFDLALERTDTPHPVFTSMSDAAFEPWIAAGLSSREASIVPREERDASPCTDYWQECAPGMLGLWGNPAYPPHW
ncbi:MAG: hypothetical protein P1V51_03920 [Deltaproteobacteria bacterium]|nr:hypothetical protein [Deltaproteobacteria bacterium]